jgi:hypothetical protein
MDCKKFGWRPAELLEAGCMLEHEHLCFQFFAPFATESLLSTGNVVRPHDEQPNKP